MIAPEMPRTVNHEVRALRRDAFLDSAQRLIQSKGYEAMSIQDVLDDLDASRGAFYHYFESKEALLDGVVERFTDAALAAAEPVLADPGLPALRKLELVIAGIASLKAEQRDLMLRLIEVLNSPANVLFREKIRRLTLARMGPVMSQVIRQGAAEGAVKVSAPEEAAWAVLALVQGYQQRATEQFVARQSGAIGFDAVRRSYAAFTEAFERILGIPAGSVRLADEATLRLWFG
jgi:AcrR family transcriptional regulator